MLNLPYQSYVAWRTCITVFHLLAVLSTILRIRTRYRSRRLWLDDYLVVIPMTVDLFYCLSPWTLPWLSPDPRTTRNFDLRTLWITLLLCFIIIWFSRICFMLSLIRILPPGRMIRSFILSLVCVFALLFCSVTLLLALHCDPYNNLDRHCVKFLRYDPATKYAYSIDIISDIIMIITPLAVLWNVKLPKIEKRVILAALSSSIVTLLLFTTLMFFTFGPFNIESLPYIIVSSMLSNLTAAASLLSCNALVVVTNLFRVYRRRVARTEEADSPETRSDGPSHPTRPNSTPAFDFQATKEDTNHGLPESSYGPNRDTLSREASESEGSVAPFSMHTLTQITMDDYYSRCSPASTFNSRSQISEPPATTTTTTTTPL